MMSPNLISAAGQCYGSGRESYVMAGSHETVTEILQAVGAGDPQAAEQLLPLVYDELRRLATAKAALVYKVWLQANRKSTTLVEQPTAAKT